jgi:hypothetical protein
MLNRGLIRRLECAEQLLTQLAAFTLVKTISADSLFCSSSRRQSSKHLETGLLSPLFWNHNKEYRSPEHLLCWAEAQTPRQKLTAATPVDYLRVLGYKATYFPPPQLLLHLGLQAWVEGVGGKGNKKGCNKSPEPLAMLRELLLPDGLNSGHTTQISFEEISGLWHQIPPPIHTQLGL